MAERFRYAERCLYDYKKNEARLEVLRMDMKVLNATSSVKVQSYNFMPAPTGISDPVSERLERIERLEGDISRLERCTLPIRNLISDLEGPDVLPDSPKAVLARILRLFYFGGNLPGPISRELSLSRAAFFRRRAELVHLAADYMCI